MKGEVASSTYSGDQFPNCAQLLGYFVQERRQQIGLTIVDASQLSGMAISEWCALESGWIPDDTALLYTIAGTLRIGSDRLMMLAMLGQSVQEFIRVA